MVFSGGRRNSSMRGKYTRFGWKRRKKEKMQRRGQRREMNRKDRKCWESKGRFREERNGMGVEEET